MNPRNPLPVPVATAPGALRGDPFGRDDPNRARLALREALGATGLEARSIPHSYDSSRLLGVAIEHAVVGRAPALLQLTARALSLHDRATEAADLLRRALRLETELHTRSTYLHTLGTTLCRAGEPITALDTFREALASTEHDRRLRVDILMSIGDTELALGSPIGAERSYRSALNLGLRDRVPLAALGRARVSRARGEGDVAKRRAEDAEAGFAELGSWRGLRAAKTERAAVCMDVGAVDEALEALRMVLVYDWTVLDTRHLGVAHSLQAQALEMSGAFESARDHARLAATFYEASAHEDGHAHALLELSRLYTVTDEPLGAAWAVHRALERLREDGNRRDEFAVLAYALHATSLGTDLGFDVTELTTRCQRIIEAEGRHLSRLSLLTFANGIQAERFVEPTPPRTTRVRARVGTFAPPAPFDLLGRLRSRLGDGLPICSAPEPRDLETFLIQFTGHFMRSRHYTREFALTQERAKRHLRALCEAGLIERQGARRGSRYALSFHRDPSPAA